MLVDRLWSKVAVRGADECWLWQAARSRGGRREVDYGAIWYRDPDGRERVWRANRLVLLLKTGPADVPQDDGEAFDDWLRRAERRYRGLDAAHLCDVSLCCNPSHLDWQDHRLNIKQQRGRRRAWRRAA